MVNVDGVVNGYYCTDISGIDLNRFWDQDNSPLCPILNSLKRLLSEISEFNRIAAFFDIHGNSMKKGVFVQGNKQPPETILKFLRADRNLGTWPTLKFYPEDFLFFLFKRSSLVNLSECRFAENKNSSSSSSSSSVGGENSNINETSENRVDIDKSIGRNYIFHSYSIPTSLSIEMSLFSRFSSKLSMYSLESNDFSR